MGLLSGEAAGSLLPVAEVLGLLVVIAGGLWAGFRWLREQIKESFQNFTKGDDFKRVVSGIIAEATAGWNDINNRMHEEHRRSIAELRKRDEERAEAVKRLHGRVDSVWERVGK